MDHERIGKIRLIAEKLIAMRVGLPSGNVLRISAADDNPGEKDKPTETPGDPQVGTAHKDPDDYTKGDFVPGEETEMEIGLADAPEGDDEKASADEVEERIQGIIQRSLDRIHAAKGNAVELYESLFSQLDIVSGIMDSQEKIDNLSGVFKLLRELRKDKDKIHMELGKEMRALTNVVEKGGDDHILKRLFEAAHKKNKIIAQAKGIEPKLSRSINIYVKEINENAMRLKALQLVTRGINPLTSTLKNVIEAVKHPLDTLVRVQELYGIFMNKTSKVFEARRSRIVAVAFEGREEFVGKVAAIEERLGKMKLLQRRLNKSVEFYAPELARRKKELTDKLKAAKRAKNAAEAKAINLELRNLEPDIIRKERENTVLAIESAIKSLRAAANMDRIVKKFSEGKYAPGGSGKSSAKDIYKALLNRTAEEDSDLDNDPSDQEGDPLGGRSFEGPAEEFGYISELAAEADQDVVQYFNGLEDAISGDMDDIAEQAEGIITGMPDLVDWVDEFEAEVDNAVSLVKSLPESSESSFVSWVEDLVSSGAAAVSSFISELSSSMSGADFGMAAASLSRSADGLEFGGEGDEDPDQFKFPAEPTPESKVDLGQFPPGAGGEAGRSTGRVEPLFKKEQKVWNRLSESDNPPTLTVLDVNPVDQEYVIGYASTGRGYRYPFFIAHTQFSTEHPDPEKQRQEGEIEEAEGDIEKEVKEIQKRLNVPGEVEEVLREEKPDGEIDQAAEVVKVIGDVAHPTIATAMEFKETLNEAVDTIKRVTDFAGQVKDMKGPYADRKELMDRLNEKQTTIARLYESLFRALQDLGGQSVKVGDMIELALRNIENWSDYIRGDAPKWEKKEEGESGVTIPAYRSKILSRSIPMFKTFRSWLESYSDKLQESDIKMVDDMLDGAIKASTRTREVLALYRRRVEESSREMTPERSEMVANVFTNALPKMQGVTNILIKTEPLEKVSDALRAHIYSVLPAKFREENISKSSEYVKAMKKMHPETAKDDEDLQFDYWVMRNFTELYGATVMQDYKNQRSQWWTEHLETGRGFEGSTRDPRVKRFRDYVRFNQPEEVYGVLFPESKEKVGEEEAAAGPGEEDDYSDIDYQTLPQDPKERVTATFRNLASLAGEDVASYAVDLLAGDERIFELSEFLGKIIDKFPEAEKHRIRMTAFWSAYENYRHVQRAEEKKEEKVRKTVVPKEDSGDIEDRIRTVYESLVSSNGDDLAEYALGLINDGSVKSEEELIKSVRTEYPDSGDIGSSLSDLWGAHKAFIESQKESVPEKGKRKVGPKGTPKHWEPAGKKKKRVRKSFMENSTVRVSAEDFGDSPEDNFVREFAEMVESGSDSDISQAMDGIIEFMESSIESASKMLAGNTEAFKGLSDMTEEAMTQMDFPDEEAPEESSGAWADIWSSIKNFAGSVMQGVSDSISGPVLAPAAATLKSMVLDKRRAAMPNDYDEFDVSDSKLEIVESEDGSKQLVLNKGLKNLVTKRVKEYFKGAYGTGDSVGVDFGDYVGQAEVLSYLGNDTYRVATKDGPKKITMDVPAKHIFGSETGLWG